LYFSDGETRIDVVLAFDDFSASRTHSARERKHDEDEEYYRMEMDRKQRATFEANLRKQGLVLELEPPQVRTTTTMKVPHMLLV